MRKILFILFIIALVWITLKLKESDNGHPTVAGESEASSRVVSRKFVERPKLVQLSDSHKAHLSKPVKSVYTEDFVNLSWKDIDALGDELSWYDRLALYELVRHSQTNRKTLFLKDEIFNQLEEQKAFPEEYAMQLTDIVADKTLDADLRGYAVQHLRSMFDKFTEDEQTIVLDTLYNALEEVNNEAGGTALLTLTEFIVESRNVDSYIVKNAAELYAFGDDSSVANKVTAMQCCVSLGVKNISLQLRDIIERENSPRGLKLSAISALAKIADEDDQAYLEAFKGADDGFYDKAIAHAWN